MRKKAFMALMVSLIIIGIFILPSCQRKTDGGATPSGATGSEAGTTDSPEKSQGKIVVITTILPLYDIARNVGGDIVEVKNLLPPGGSPHTYEPTVEDSRNIEDANVIFMVGLGLDTWMEKLTSAMGEKGKMKIFTLSDGVKILSQTEVEEIGTHSGEDSHNKEGAVNPHIWMDPMRMKKMAEDARDAYISIRPDQKEIFEQNCKIYQAKLDGLDKLYSEELSKFKKKDFITFHAFLGYLSKRYGLNEVAVISTSPGQEPDPRHIAEVIEILKKYRVKIVFAEPQFSPREAEAIAREINGKVAIVDPIGALDDPKRDTYVKNMKENLKAFTEAFSEEN
ncbi:MAG: metal ABC transporter substrate-binding protein [Candidatus Eremiobacteraeota bacterium]|nr:metal ABC transporter substrate-binding protein [Candidatus Eremiobacteraeota bacterium]